MIADAKAGKIDIMIVVRPISRYLVFEAEQLFTTKRNVYRAALLDNN